jgi:hypothetical protein
MINIQEQNNQLVLSFFIIYVFSLISLITFGIGADDSGYLMYWNDTYPLYDYLFGDKILEKRAIESTYSYLFAFFKIFFHDFEVFKFFNTFITLSIMAYAYFKISKKYYLYMLLYTVIYLFLDFNIDQFRNALAASFGLLSIVLLVENKFKYSLIWFLFSVLVHNSMVWMLVIYITRNKYIFYFTIVSLLLLIVSNELKDILLYISDLYFHSSHLAAKVYGYLKNEDFQESASIFSLVFLKSLFIYILTLKEKLIMIL